MIISRKIKLQKKKNHFHFGLYNDIITSESILNKIRKVIRIINNLWVFSLFYF